jgi:hypothetical protein
MNFGPRFWVEQRVSGGDCRCQSGVSGAMAGAYVQLECSLYRYAVCGWIDYASVECSSFFSSAAQWVASYSESRLYLSLCPTEGER